MKFHADKLTKEELHQRRWLIHAVMSLGLILVVMAVSSVNVALPTLQKDLNASPTDLQWIVDGYAITFAGLVLFGGALGDRFGRRKAFLAGMAVFGVFTYLSAFADSASQLILYRTMMGVGAALVMPATLSIISNAFSDDKERARAVAMWAGFAGASGAIGPIISGVLLAHFWWGSVFLLPVPVIIIATFLTMRVVPESRDPEAERLDTIGAILSVAGLGTVLYGIIEAPNHGWLNTETLAFIVGGLIILTAFFFWEKHSKHPMLPVRFFASRRFSTGSLALLLTFFALFGMFFVLIQYLQFVLGYSPLAASVRTLPAPISLVVAASLVTRIEARLGTRKTVTAGLLIVAVGFVLFAGLGVTSSTWRLLSGLVLIGVGMGFAMPPATEAIIGAVPKRKAGVGSAMNDTTREVGGAIGIAVLGSVLTSAYRSDIANKVGSYPTEVAHAVKDSIGTALQTAAGAGANGGALKQVASSSFVHGMAVTMWVATGFLVLSALVVFVLMVDAEEPIADDEPLHDLPVSTSDISQAPGLA